MSKKVSLQARKSRAEQKKAKAAEKYADIVAQEEQTTKKRERLVARTVAQEKRIAEIRARKDAQVIQAERAKAASEERNAKYQDFQQIKSRLQASIANATIRGDESFKAKLEARLQKVEARIAKNSRLANSASARQSALEQKAGNLAQIETTLQQTKEKFGQLAVKALEKEVVLTQKAIKLQDEYDRNKIKADAANGGIAAVDCNCLSVYEPVSIDGVVYSNACVAQCDGKTIPSTPEPLPPPISPDGTFRKCRNIPLCGSDGRSYNDCAKPYSVHAIVYGQTCAEIGYTPTGSGLNSVNRPPAARSKDGILFNIIQPQVAAVPTFSKLCGNNNQTYSIEIVNGEATGYWKSDLTGEILNDSTNPSSVKLKHWGSCNNVP